MRILLNGDAVDFEAATLADFVEMQEFDPDIVATAVNGEFVPRLERAEMLLADGDQVEVFSPRQGG
ncbi:sulfur carrier protein ThiS [Hartmannibacter diazotrophicus]|uniref:Sulfur carrier protein ThiS n=1 Tax=Hartmannibacter diazotrophicus TaxID=1482074 RepID=A0A2C9D960_9HYPH|nr:sulfur carrier protein ThiS [Hartmannibacter diazotrophicus]SON56271.1 sulfur carrier protein ThiS [Hartmannibacter diazotrophicus]